MKNLFRFLTFLTFLALATGLLAANAPLTFDPITGLIRQDIKVGPGRSLIFLNGGTMSWDANSVFIGDKAAFRNAIGVPNSTFDGYYSSLLNKPTLGTAAPYNVPALVGSNAAPTEVVRGDDPRLTDKRLPPDTAVTPGTYGDATHIPTIVIGADGRATSAGQTLISTGAGDLSSTAASSTDGQGVEFNLTTGKVVRPSTRTGIIFENSGVRGTATVNLPIQFSGGTLFMAPATASVPGYLTAADWTTFNAKQSLITAGTTGQYYRGDKTFQTLDKAAVGIPNVDNTSDVNKPISIAQQAALDGKVSLSGNDMIGGIKTGSLNFDWPYLNLAGGTALAIRTNYFDSLTANRTLTIDTTGIANGTNGSLILNVSNTPTITFGTGFGLGVYRIGQAVTQQTTLPLTAGVHVINYRYVNGAFYISESAATSVAAALVAIAHTGINYTNAADLESVITNIDTALGLLAPKNSPTLTGTPLAPTATLGTNTAQIATTAFAAAVVKTPATGGTGIDTSASTGFPYLTSGVWSVKTAAQQRVLARPASSSLSGSTPAIDWSASDGFYWTLAANSTPTFSNVGDNQTIRVAITNTASNYTVTWSGVTVTWKDGSTPVTTPGVHTDIYTFTRLNGITYGSVVQNF